MKKAYIILSILFTLICVSGCQSTKLKTASSPQNETVSSFITKKQNYTKDDIIQFFNNNKRSKDFTATDCVVVDDNAYGILGIIQYTNQENNPCNLGFVNEDKCIHPINIARDGDFKIADDSILTYAGDGKVTLSLTKIETEKTFDFAVEYLSQNNNINFKVSSYKRK